MSKRASPKKSTPKRFANAGADDKVRGIINGQPPGRSLHFCPQPLNFCSASESSIGSGHPLLVGVERELVSWQKFLMHLFTFAVFQNPPLAMLTLLALLPVLAPTSQAAPLTSQAARLSSQAAPLTSLAAPLSSGPNPSDFGIRQRIVLTPRAKRSIIPLIEGAANYWLRCICSFSNFDVFFYLFQIGRDQCNARKVSVGPDKRGGFKEERGKKEEE